MKENRDLIRDITAMRSMMERSSKFLSLSGLAAVLAGIYALAGAWIAWQVYDFQPVETTYSRRSPGTPDSGLLHVVFLASIILVMAIGTAVFLSYEKAAKRGEKLWNPTAKRLVIHMAVPLITGGLLVLVLAFKGLIAFIAPVTLVFYGLALYDASKFSYEELRSMGLVQTGLGLLGCWFTGYGLLFWALGFGAVHIVYGIYMFRRYER